MSKMVIIGTGSAVGVLIIVLMVLCRTCRKKGKKAETKSPDKTDEKNDETVPLMKETSASRLSAVRSSSKRLPDETASVKKVTSSRRQKSRAGSKESHFPLQSASLGRTRTSHVSSGSSHVPSALPSEVASDMTSGVPSQVRTDDSAW